MQSDLGNILNNSACQNCGLCKTRKYVINGQGNPQAKIVLILDHPGLKDDENGTVVGDQLGEYLDKLLQGARLTRNDVFITYLVRCLPKAPAPAYVRDASWEEISLCKPYLTAELAAIKPTVIIPLGAIPLKAIMGSKKVNITDYRGKETWSNEYNCKIMPTFDPAAAFRNPRYEHIIMQDLSRAHDSSLYPELTVPKEGTYVTVDSIELFDEFISKIASKPEWVFDIETSGLNWIKDKVLCIAFSWAERTGICIPLTRYYGRPEEYTEEKKRTVRKKVNKQWVKSEKIVTKTKTRIIDEYYPYWEDKQEYVLGKLKELFASDSGKIAHNGKFDVKFLMKQCGFKVNNLSFDTILAHHLLDENAEGLHGLKDCALFYTDMGAYDDPIENFFKERKIAKNKKNYAHIPPETLYKYACMDADCTMRLKNRFVDLMREDEVDELFERLIMPLNTNLLQAEYDGVKIDKAYLLQLKQEIGTEIASQLANLKAKAGDINFNSDDQLAKLLFDTLKLPSVKKTPSGAESTDDEVLEALSELHPIPALIREHRKLAKLYDTYICGIEEALDENDRIHTTFLIYGTTTGRLSSKEPNLQNIPKDDKRIKNLFVAEDGWEMLERDYAQAEFRLWGNYSEDETMLDDLRKGLDIHKVTASNVLQIPMEEVDDKQRKQAKSIVFGLIFGMGVDKLARENGCSREHATKVIRTFFSRYPRARAWLEGAVHTVQQYGQIRSVFGRLRRLPGISSMDNEVRATAERQAKNSPIQGAASDLCCNAANRIVNRFAELGLHGKLRLLIHDAIIVEFPKEEREVTIQVTREEMERPVRGIIVPLSSDAKIGTRWGELQKVVEEHILYANK